MATRSQKTYVCAKQSAQYGRFLVLDLSKLTEAAIAEISNQVKEIAAKESAFVGMYPKDTLFGKIESVNAYSAFRSMWQTEFPNPTDYRPKKYTFSESHCNRELKEAGDSIQHVTCGKGVFLGIRNRKE